MTQENLIPFRCKISTTDAAVPLGMRITLNDQLIFESLHVAKIIEVSHQLLDDGQDYILKFEMLGKTNDHTQIDGQGNIIKDTCLTVCDVEFDDIRIDSLFAVLTNYTHDNNGHSAEVEDKFYGSMGCNGYVTLKFSTPIYLWLLENL